MVNTPIWPSIIGGIMAMGFNWANVAVISQGIVIPASLHFSGFITGFLIVFTTMLTIDIVGTPRIFRDRFYTRTRMNTRTRMRAKNKEDPEKEDNTKKISAGERNT